VFSLRQLPPLPPGAIGWNVYTGGGRFVEFAGDEEAVSAQAATLADEVAAFAGGVDEPPQQA
jgi:hypothetical protein